jgi:protoporphyrinogen/coproporphyrinogen III oxidase
MIVIIGGGLTGLATAHYLAGRGVPHVVLEAAERPGGVIRSGRVRGHVLEWGPQRARLTDSMRALVAELGLEGELITAPPGLPLYVYRAGKLRRVPFSVGEFLGTDLLSWAGKLRILREPFTGAPRDDESVADFFTRRIGREAYENLVGPLYGGLYGSDPANMRVGLSLAHVLREFGLERSLLLPLLRRGGRITPPAACSFREGMQTLPRALYEHNRPRVRLGTPVRGLARAEDGYRVELDGETLRARQVVLTAEAPSAARLLTAVAPEAARRVRTLTYNPLVVVHAYAETDLVGLGYQVSLAERSYTRGVTFNDSLFGRKGVYTIYLGGARAPKVMDWSDEQLIETALREFREATGFRAEPLAVERERMPAWDHSWAALDGLRVPEGLFLAANWESRPGIPGRLLQARRLSERLAD